MRNNNHTMTGLVEIQDSTTFSSLFQAVAAGRNEAPVIFDSAGGGYRKLLDPYVSTYRTYHRPFTADDQYGIGAKDHITFYSESNTPKVTSVFFSWLWLL